MRTLLQSLPFALLALVSVPGPIGDGAPTRVALVDSGVDLTDARSDPRTSAPGAR